MDRAGVFVVVKLMAIIYELLSEVASENVGWRVAIGYKPPNVGPHCGCDWVSYGRSVEE